MGFLFQFYFKPLISSSGHQIIFYFFFIHWSLNILHLVATKYVNMVATRYINLVLIEIVYLVATR
jgi:hypothetical protein